MLIAHLSDTHFGCERPEVVDALVERLLSLAPDVLILSGDITQRARPEEYRRARAFLDRLPGPRRLVIPGNHDLPLMNLLMRLLSPLGGFRRSFGADTPPVLETPEVLIVPLNTTRAWRHKHGAVSAAQIDTVSTVLRHGQPTQLKIVITHHPAAVIRREDEPNRLRRAERALTAWRRAGADLVLGGHIHLPYVAPWPAGLPPDAQPLWVVQAGTAVSRRVRHEAGNSFNLIRALPPRSRERWCAVERWDHQPGQGFVLALSRPLPLADR